MEAKREQAAVGLFVLIATALIIIFVFTISGAFGHSAKTFHALFPFAGGLEPGAAVRYAGGPKVGRVESLHVDPQHPDRIDVVLSVGTDAPVKTDSHVRIMSMSPLGDNHLEIVPGSAPAPLAQSGATLKSDPYVDFNALTSQLSDLAPDAQKLIRNLNDRATELQVTVARVNDLLNDQNRANLGATIAQARGMIAENRPLIRNTLTTLNTSSAKLGPLLDDLRKTSDQANQALAHVDAMVGETRPEIRLAIADLRKLLASTNDLTGRINETLDVNSDNIDESLENLRHITDNLKEFTDTIKNKPYTLIRASTPREHKTGGPR